jgi:hypothetical protein
MLLLFRPIGPMHWVTWPRQFGLLWQSPDIFLHCFELLFVYLCNKSHRSRVVICFFILRKPPKSTVQKYSIVMTWTKVKLSCNSVYNGFRSILPFVFGIYFLYCGTLRSYLKILSFNCKSIFYQFILESMFDADCRIDLCG